MNRKFKLVCEGKLVGALFISNQERHMYIVGTIAPFKFSRIGDDIDFVGEQHITDLYLPETSDEFIKADLINKVKFENCKIVSAIPY